VVNFYSKLTVCTVSIYCLLEGITYLFLCTNKAMSYFIDLELSPYKRRFANDFNCFYLYLLHYSWALFEEKLKLHPFAIQIGSDWPQMGQILDFIRSVSVHWCIIEKWDALWDLFFLSYLFHVNLLCLLKMNLWIYKNLCLINIHCKYCDSYFIYWCIISIYLSKAGLIKVDLLLPRFISFHLTVFY